MKSIEWRGKLLAVSLGLGYLLVFDTRYTWAIFILVMMTVGIPHGSIDHLLAGKQTNRKELFLFFTKYIGIILLYAVLWYLLPIVSLIVFLIISAYHFGQGHFISHEIKQLKWLTYIIFGAHWLIVILASDPVLTIEILQPIINVYWWENIALIVLLVSSIACLTLTFIHKLHVHSKFLTELIGLTVLLYTLPLLLSFALYFGFWHALPTMIQEYKALKNKQADFNLMSFVKQLIPLTLISLIGITFLLWASQRWLEEEALILLFFILISVITAPHVIVMDRFLEKRTP
ncbi:Brp/Blh family beta-carotene 15,15'-dioxygenase [Penaeicola halotolerans]|uniref:Brp/Blh family beta-carotene 15,15'-dioxygenase n=1 Tax=Penaeicola halotolerans TaxID=2793196 RepID=UPI001CF8B6C0|nr:Brp/Blh family beta-carotene 15,15'-dioxygenase [Penaeicola halotolerans]